MCALQQRLIDPSMPIKPQAVVFQNHISVASVTQTTKMAIWYLKLTSGSDMDVYLTCLDV